MTTLNDLSGLTPVHITMGRLAAIVRGSVTAVAVAAAAVGTVPPISWAWVGPTLAVSVTWTAVHVYLSWARGVLAWVAGIDLALAAALCLVVGRLEPAGQDPGSTWVGVVVSMIVIWAQPARPAPVFVAGGCAVAFCYVLGADLWHIPETGYSQGITIATQVVAGALVVRIASRAGREAADTFATLQAAEHAAAVEADKREDQRLQMRLLHNGPVTTLSTAVNMSGTRAVTPVMRARAAADLATLTDGQVMVDVDGDVRLDERLAQSLVWYEAYLRIDSQMASSLVPASVAQAFAIATTEAMENVSRHANADRVYVRLVERDGTLSVTIRDEGRGFVLDRVPRQRFGIRESIVAEMAAVEGAATVLSRVGQGTEVNLTWRRD